MKSDEPKDTQVVALTREKRKRKSLRGRVANVFRRVSGLFSRSSTRRKRKEKDDAKEAKEERSDLSGEESRNKETTLNDSEIILDLDTKQKGPLIKAGEDGAKNDDVTATNVVEDEITAENVTKQRSAPPLRHSAQVHEEAGEPVDLIHRSVNKDGGGGDEGTGVGGDHLEGGEGKGGSSEEEDDVTPIMGRKKRGAKNNNSNKNNNNNNNNNSKQKSSKSRESNKENGFHDNETGAIDISSPSKKGLSNNAFTFDDNKSHGSTKADDNGDSSSSSTKGPIIGSHSSSESISSSLSSSSQVGGDDASGDADTTHKQIQHMKRGMKHILKRKISTTFHQMDLDHSDPEFVITVMALPTVQTFSGIKKKLRLCNQEWMQGFLDLEGLDRLLDCVDTYASRRVTALADALILVECVECIRAVLNSKIGMSVLVQKPEYTRRLIKAHQGLEMLFECLSLSSAHAMSSGCSLGNLLLRFECVRCIKSCINSWEGVEFLISESTRYSPKFAAALDTNNAMVKKQVVELLSALSMYSDDGYRLAMDALDTFKALKQTRYRFSILINELKSCELIPYKTSLMGFINCILCASDDLHERNRIRNEFVGLDLLDILTNLRNDNDKELEIQCDVFEDYKHDDEEELALTVPEDIDVTNHKELFETIFNKVYNTPSSDKFLTILQTLLQIDGENNVCDLQWDLMEHAAQTAIVMDNSKTTEDLNNSKYIDKMIAQSLISLKHQPSEEMKDTSVQTDEILNPEAKVNGVMSPSTGERIITSNSSSSSAPPPPPPPPPPPISSLPPSIQASVIASSSAPPPPPPPPPPPLPPGMAPPPPPPPPPFIPGGAPPPPPPPPFVPGGAPPPPPPPPPPPGGGPPPPPPPPPPPGGGPPPPPPPPGMGGGIPGQPWGPQSPSLNPISTPQPKHKMKTFNWSKIPLTSLNSEDNVWKEVLEMDDMVKVKYDQMEQLFCQKVIEKKEKEKEEAKAKPPTEINLLDMKRSMNANIFLKQFKMGHGDIVNMIKEGDTIKIGAERLRGLNKIMPSSDEVAQIKNFNGDKSKLGNAEKFYMQLISLPGYVVRIEGMVLKDDFRIAMDSLKPNVDMIITASDKLIDNDSLKGFLRYVLHAGNFINAGGYAGNALGFKVASLNKLMDTRANKPRVTLLHYLVDEAHKQEDEVLDFADELEPVLSSACRLTVDNLTAENRQLQGNIKQLKTKVSKADQDVQDQFASFIEKSENDIESIQEKLAKIAEFTKKLAHHFCENEKSFKLEECLNNFNTFCNKVKQCKKDNEQRKLQEERAEKRRQANAAMKANKGSKEHKFPPEEDGCIIDNLLKDIKKGFNLRKTSPSKKGNGPASPDKLKSKNIDSNKLQNGIDENKDKPNVKINNNSIVNGQPESKC